MRKTVLVSFVASIIFSMYSCNNDDDAVTADSSNFETLIIGKWVLSSSTENGENFYFRHL